MILSIINDKIMKINFIYLLWTNKFACLEGLGYEVGCVSYIFLLSISSTECLSSVL